ncbi:MAG: hypothetical protein B9S33_11955 [Pedosphaera sp. Tous-C6FEB]|nr:MAG: hypothetical protein B9S33_11955 [Pedosphaera sp. Tous-C6FEB]
MASDERTRGTPRRKWLPLVAFVLVVDAIGGWLYYRWQREHSQDTVIRAARATAWMARGSPGGVLER